MFRNLLSTGLFSALTVLLLSLPSVSKAQPNINSLPQYIVVNSYHRVALSEGINVYIDQTAMKDNLAVAELSEFISTKKSGHIVHNFTDLLNIMDQVGYEYVNSFSDSQDTSNNREGDDGLDTFVGGHGDFETCVVFRKKA